MALLSTLVSGLVMWLAIWMMTRRDGSVSLKPVLLISFATSVMIFFALRFLGSWGLGVTLVGLIFALIHWLDLSWPKSTLIAVLWLLSQVGFGLFVSPIF